MVEVCNEEVTDALLRHIYSLYAEWAGSSSFNLTSFWDMRKQKFMMLNGPYGPHTVLECPFAGSYSDLAFEFGENLVP